MSQALYRRYRPETFADVIGQEHVTEPLQQALRTGRVNHAYLFSGPRGCGKTTSARILARCLNCDEGPTDTPCGTCDSCIALARGGAGTVDVIEIDAASHGGVDDARELRERASYGPAQSRYKIYIIDEAHMVTTQGFNALLKIVEEPPEHVKFVFATTEPEKVIGTIRSRTHHYPFRLVPPAQLQDYLGAVCASEGVQVEPGVLSFVVRAGGGSVRDSLSVLDQLIAGSGSQGLTYEGAAALLGFTDAELLDATVTAIGHGDAAAAFAQVDRVIETGLDPRRFVEDLLERFRDLIICAAIPDGAEAVLRAVPSDQLERMHVQAGSFGAGGLSRAADVVNSGLTEMTGTTSPRLQLELIIARLLLPGAAGPQGYAARLDRIERRLDLWMREGAGSAGGAGNAAEVPPEHGHLAQTPARSGPPVADGTGSRQGDPGRREPAQPNSRQPDQGQPNAEQPPPVHPHSEQSAQPAPEPVASTVRGAPGAAPAAGRDQAAIVRAWPDILDWLSRHKRVTWTLVSASAQPLSFDGSRLVLAIDTAGLAETFRRGAHPSFVQEALLEVLGIEARVEGVVSETAPDAARAGTASSAGATSSSRTGPPTRSRPSGAAPADTQTPSRSTSPGPAPEATQADWSSAPPPTSSAPSWASEERDPIESAPPTPASAPQDAPTRSNRPDPGPLATVVPIRREDPGPPVAVSGDDPSEVSSPEDIVDDPDAISDDDEDIEASGDVGQAVVERLLGGTVISEDEEG